MKANKSVIALVLIVAVILIASNAMFVVDETHQVVVTQFQKVVGAPITHPGLYFKWPVIQQTHYLPKNILDWDGDPGQVPTLDKTYIWVDTFARWRITNPVAFYLTVTKVSAAMNRLDEVINPAVRNVITSHKLIETVRNSNRKMTALEPESIADGAKGTEQAAAPSLHIKFGREKLTKMMLAQAQPKLDRFGIELIDIKIKRINYIEKVRKSVYGRMIAERRQIAEKIRSTGEGEASKIEGEKDRDLQVIRSTAFRKAEEIKGKADAESAEIYAKAYGVDPEFYSFEKSLQVYRKTLSGADLVLSTDSEFLKYLETYKPAPDSGKK